MTDAGGVLLAIVIMILVPLFYVFPWLIARDKKHHNTGAILAVNLLLGWTFIGWIWALVWALSNPSPSAAVPVSAPAVTRACLTCGRIGPADGKFCPGCGTAAPA